MERFHSRGHELCKFIGKKERFYIGKDFNCHRTWFGTPTWPPLNCFGATTWWTSRHVKKVYMFVMPRKVDLFTK